MVRAVEIIIGQAPGGTAGCELACIDRSAAIWIQVTIPRRVFLLTRCVGYNYVRGTVFEKALIATEAVFGGVAV